jgi:hypothetical protein
MCFKFGWIEDAFGIWPCLVPDVSGDCNGLIFRDSQPAAQACLTPKMKADEGKCFSVAATMWKVRGM